ncbi:MAG: hypothetical protein LBP86_04950 [Azoarcus sp.]|jgi:hypothetical protein|nr:hypothetical protein [Azoarcus sp.]
MATTFLGSLLSLLPAFSFGLTAGRANVSVNTGSNGVGVGVQTPNTTVGVGVTPEGVGVEVTAPNTGINVLVQPGSFLAGIFSLISGIGSLFLPGSSNNTAEKTAALLPEDDESDSLALFDVDFPADEDSVVDIVGSDDADAADFAAA